MKRKGDFTDETDKRRKTSDNEYKPGTNRRNEFATTHERNRFLGGKYDDDFRRAQEQDPIKKENPHLVQSEKIEKYTQDFDEKNRILQEDAPRMVYQRRRGQLKSVLHWGQRKLLLSEIEFLAKCCADRRDFVVLYAGAAPGTHIPYLCDLFPELKFVLVDPSDFMCYSTNKITVVKDYFTDELAKKYAAEYKDQLLFISDIRTASWETMNEEEVEEFVLKDMLDQMRWHEILQPYKSMFKFRLPWKEGKTKYLNGEIFLPVWGPQTTTETRLITTSGYKEYDHKQYEEQLFYFNTHTRVMHYEHNLKVPGMDHCFDCMSEIYILKSYLTKFKPEESNSEEKLNEMIVSMSQRLSKECSPSGRTLENSPLNVIKKFNPKTEEHRNYDKQFRGNVSEKL